MTFQVLIQDNSGVSPLTASPMQGVINSASGSAQITIAGSQPQTAVSTPGTITLAIHGDNKYRALCIYGSLSNCVYLPMDGASLTITVGSFTAE
jgi:hypothetical protein